MTFWWRQTPRPRFASVRSYRHEEGVEVPPRRRVSIILEREDVALDGFAHVLDRGFASVALGHAARKA